MDEGANHRMFEEVQPFVINLKQTNIRSILQPMHGVIECSPTCTQQSQYSAIDRLEILLSVVLSYHNLQRMIALLE